jgi:hypothetical protein
VQENPDMLSATASAFVAVNDEGLVISSLNGGSPLQRRILKGELRRFLMHLTTLIRRRL